ncbi:IS1182 family transposase [Rhizobium rhizogenes]|uniref:IS1182 family transposase n=1 Tax=Rhizobium rhizogenes TaxID=359 RepID=UPI001571E67E|nr:IS1182 family transposase [Rhizobium rhizogenes]NTI32899.1 IS1182 family transposase [Rhizobium rhizogenes]
MAHLSGIDRSQLLLLPEAVDDYVGPDNPVRFIEAFVDGLDLNAAGFVRVAAKDTGRPGYDPGDLLKLYTYGYLNRVRSSRRLEAESHRNVEVIWLLRHLKPDFRTIADFRRVNRSAFKQVFREFVILCRQLDLFGRELLAVDGTRIKAVNNKDRNFTRGALTTFIREADEKLSDYMKRLDEGDAEEEASSSGSGSSRGDGKLAEKIAAIKGKRDRHKALLDELDRTGEDQISLTDPDARAMARMTKVGVGYNIQLAVDVKHKLIAEQEVSNQVLDMGLLAPTVEAAMDTLGVEKIEAIADRGYFKIEDIEACEKAGITAFVPKPVRGPAVAQGFFSKEEFRYDAEADVYTCPADQVLRPRYYGKSRENVKVIYCDRKVVCKTCGLRPSCTAKSYRGITRLENEAVLDRMADRLAARPGILDIRRESVEHPFGTVKQWMYQGAFLMRRLENVRGEFSLTALAYNIKRAITIVGVPALISAVRA